jgi:hypothetical protein
MSTIKPTNLAQNLENSYTSIQELISGIDLETPIVENPEWRIREILWHLAVWDRQVAQSIEAFEYGGRYAIPEFNEDIFNQASIEEGRQLSLEQVQKESRRARQEFIRVVERFPPGQLQAELLYPWGDESGDIAKLVSYMVSHDEEHHAEIMASISI